VGYGPGGGPTDDKGKNKMKGQLKVAIQGYEGSFHHIVAHRCLGTDIAIHPCATFREVARQVETGEADYGVMAVENSIAGTCRTWVSCITPACRSWANITCISART